MEGRRVGIRDVAREAGVSVTTVSHALNDKGRLNPETRERVRAIAARLGYRPNPAARSLVSGRAGLIAAVMPLPTGARSELADVGTFTDLITAATGVAVANDTALVVSPSATTPGEPHVWDRVPVDGVVVVGPMAGDPALPALRERRIPFVTVGRDPDGEDRDAVITVDHRLATRSILDHLRSAGARQPGMVGMPPSYEMTRESAAAYEAWCRENGVEAAIELVSFEDLLRDRSVAVAHAVERLLERGVDAISCPVEQLGVAALEALRSRGVDVPADVLLATTSDAGRASSMIVPLTTVDTDNRELGRRATELLLRLVSGESTAPVLELVPTAITVRASTTR